MSDSDVQESLLKIWCIQNNFDNAFITFLIKEHGINSFFELQRLTRFEFRQLLKKLNLDSNKSFEHPSIEDEFIKALDKTDVIAHAPPPMPAPIPYFAPAPAPPPIGAPAPIPMSGAPLPPPLPNAAPLPNCAPIPGGAPIPPPMSAPIPGGAPIPMGAPPPMGGARAPMASRFDDDDSIGFKVGASYDIEAFRSKLKRKQMPKAKDISVEGIYNDYFFDTRKKQKGVELKENDENDQTEGKDDDEIKENAQSGKDLFYPSYCYAKSKAPFASLASKDFTKDLPDIDSDDEEQRFNKKKKKKQAKKEKKNIVTDCVEKVMGIWNGYIECFGYEPTAANELYKFSSLATTASKYKINYKEASQMYTRYKGGGKIVIAPKAPMPMPATATNDMFEDELDEIVFGVNDDQMKNREIFMTVGLNSNISAKDFQRKKLNLCILLDVSGSMNSRFINDKVTTNKIEIAKKSIFSLITTNLKHDDRFSLVTFNRSGQIYSELFKISEHKIDEFRRISSVYAYGGTNFESGYTSAIRVFENLYRRQKVHKDDEMELYDNRIIILTDLNPNMGSRDPQNLMKMVEKYSKDDAMRIYTTFIGVGLDFNSDLVSKLTKVRGANYFSVHNNDAFMKKMSEEFEYMVSPLVFDFSLTLHSEGDVAYIEGVYGAGNGQSESLKNGQIMTIDTLFPSPPNKEQLNEKKGGIVLLKIRRKDKGNDAKKKFNMIIECKFEDKHCQKYENRQIVEFGEDNKLNEDDYYDNNGVQKGIVLARYVTLISEWLKYEKYEKKKSNQIGKKLSVSVKYKKIFGDFLKYFEEQIEIIGDDDMKKELDILEQLSSDSLDPIMVKK